MVALSILNGIPSLTGLARGGNVPRTHGKTKKNIILQSIEIAMKMTMDDDDDER